MNLLDMPMLPLRRILYWMSLTELFLISFTSDKLRYVIAHLLFDAYMDLTAKKGEFEFEIHANDPRKKLRITTKYPFMPCTEKKFRVMIGDQEMKLSLIYEHPTDKTFVYFKKKYVGKMITIGMPYIVELFGPREINLYVSIRKMQKFIPPMYVTRMTIPDKRVKASQVEAILAKITVNHHLRIANKVTGKFPLNTRLTTMRQLQTCQKWMKPEHILNFEGEHGSFAHTQFRDEHIIAFLRKWISGKYPLLATYMVHTKHRFSPSNVVGQFDTRPWDPSKRARHYPNLSETCLSMEKWRLQSVFDCDVGYDIVGKNGLLATFKMNSNHFFFFVWFNRFPKRVGNHVVNE